MSDFHRRGGGGRLIAWALVATPLLALVATIIGLADRVGAAGPRLEPLRGHQALVPPGATPLGPAPDSTVLPLVVTLQPRNPGALAAEAQAVSNPSSPQYRHFLTPQQFARDYGPTPATLAQVTDALRQEGLTVGAPAATDLSLPVSGTVAQVQAAFATPIDRYRLSSGKTGYHNRSAPEVPASVAPQIQGIIGLDTLNPPQPTSTLPEATPGRASPGTSEATPALAPGQPQPTGTTCTNNIKTVMSDYGALDAVKLAQAYSFGPLYNAGDYGSGATVALVEMSGAGYSASDLATFATCYGITVGPNQITERNVGSNAGGTGPGTVEAELDIETVLAMAPKANIQVYEGNASSSIYTVLSAIVSDDTAQVVSVSWTNGCEAYVGSATQNAENTLLQAAATEGQSVFVAAGDQGSEGCNDNAAVVASTGSHPVAQAVDPSTGTLYVANQSGSSLSVISEGSGGNGDFTTPTAVPTGTSPDAVALDAADKKVFVANAGTNSLTVVSTTSCNQGTTSGCGAPTTVSSNGHLSGPTALAVSGTTLYVANNNGTVDVYNASTNTYVTKVSLPLPSSPDSLAVDAANGVVYVGDAGTVSRVDYFNATTCNATTTSGCATAPATVSLAHSPVSLVVDDAAGSLYVASAGSGGGIAVVGLTSHTVTTTILLSGSSFYGTGTAQSVALSPSGSQVLVVVSGLTSPGDVLATVNPTTNRIVATADLETGSDTVGAAVSDSTRNYVWVADASANDDVVQNLNLAVTDPASQPYATAVGGTTVSALGPPPTESTWNDQLHYAEGAGGGGISQTFAMPAWQQPLGTVTGSSGTPCNNTGGDCREIPDVSADGDPSTGYVVYDAVNGYDWVAIGGTSGAAPLWAAVLAVDASADGDAAGYGAMNPILYRLAQQSPGTYFNDVTTGNNDYNGTDGGVFAATSGYDMATGLGTPITSALATGLTPEVDVAVSGTQTYGGSPSFTGTPTTPPSGITVDTSALSCAEVGPSTTITPTLPAGSHQLVPGWCGGVTLSGPNAADYAVVYTGAAGDFVVSPAPLTVTASSGTMTYGGTPPAITPAYAGFVNGQNQSAFTTAPTCSTTATATSTVAGSPYGSSCSGAVDPNYSFTYVPGSVSVTQAPLTVTASSKTMTYGGTPPTITPTYAGFVNGQSKSAFTTAPTCSTTATATSTVAGSPYGSSCSGAVDPNYSFTYVPGTVSVNGAPLTITASSPAMTYGGTPPSITPSYSGFVNGEDPSVLTAAPSCSTGATSSSPASPPTYAATCSGAAAANYAITYVAGTVTVNKAPLTITASGGTMSYGGTPPAITPTYAGFVNGDTTSALTAAAACSTMATGSSSVAGSPYPSTCSGATDPDYTFTYVPGTVTVTQVPLTITASNGIMTYGGPVPTITAGYSGFVNGDSSSSLTTKPICGTTARSSSSVSTSPYPSSCSGAVDPNYAVTYAGGTVTVNPATLVVTASSPSMTYGSTPPAIVAGYTGFKNGDTASSLTTQPTCTSTVTDASLPSPPTYPSSCSGASDPNYTVSDVAGAVTVNPAPIAVTVSGSQNYGSSPGFTATPPPSLPAGVTAVTTSGVTCSQVQPATAITSTMAAGSYTLMGTSCSGASLAGPNATDYSVLYAATTNDFSVSGGPPPPAQHGYWLVGSDGGIFTFGSATFHGSTGSLQLQRPVVGITPTKDEGGYWLVASDGGIFAFGDAGFYGSIPGLGLHPAGSGVAPSLNAPIVGMVPSSDGGGYFMVASDGGVFAFGDAQFEGSCPGIGGCGGPAVSVVPDATGRGYWLVTQNGNVYTFGDAAYDGAPGPQSAPITAAVRSADGRGYFVLLADGTVDGYGDATPLGGPVGAVGGFDPASAIFTDSDGGGYWVASAAGAVFTYGDAPNDGSMAGTRLNGAIIAGTGF